MRNRAPVYAWLDSVNGSITEGEVGRTGGFPTQTPVPIHAHQSWQEAACPGIEMEVESGSFNFCTNSALEKRSYAWQESEVSRGPNCGH